MGAFRNDVLKLWKHVLKSRSQKDKTTWERVYGQAHTAWSLMNDAVYGIAAWHGLGANRWSEARWDQLEHHFS